MPIFDIKVRRRKDRNLPARLARVVQNGPARSISVKSVRTDSNSKIKVATTSSDGGESHRWREGTATLQNAEIAPLEEVRVAPEEPFH